jgi:hypothetical protein
MLLSDAEITKYLGIARKEVRAKLRLEGKNLKKELEMFRRSANTYTNMSDARLEQEYYEEYLADQFELFKTGPKNTNTSSEVKSLFTRILEWIESVFNSYSKNDLNTLFENIDAGKYYSSTPVVNQFTSQTGITLEANALLPYDEREETTEVLQPDGSTKQITREGFLYVDNDVADPLIRSIAAMYLSRVSKITQPNTNRGEILDNVVDDFYELYNPLSEHNVNKSESQKEILESITNALDNYLDRVYGYIRGTAFRPRRTTTLSPQTGAVAQVVTVTGTGYAPIKELSISFSGGVIVTTPVSVISSTVGAFSFTFPIPTGTLVGAVTLKVNDTIGGLVENFQVI